jgi:hypothetical protein
LDSSVRNSLVVRVIVRRWRGELYVPAVEVAWPRVRRSIDEEHATSTVSGKLDPREHVVQREQAKQESP